MSSSSKRRNRWTVLAAMLAHAHEKGFENDLFAEVETMGVGSWFPPAVSEELAKSYEIAPNGEIIRHGA